MSVKSSVVGHNTLFTASSRKEIQSSIYLLDFGPQGNTQITSIGLAASRNSNWTFYHAIYKQPAEQADWQSLNLFDPKVFLSQILTDWH